MPPAQWFEFDMPALEGHVLFEWTPTIAVTDWCKHLHFFYFRLNFGKMAFRRKLPRRRVSKLKKKLNRIFIYNLQKKFYDAKVYVDGKNL